jgi:hypothetical protein
VVLKSKFSDLLSTIGGPAVLSRRYFVAVLALVAMALPASAQDKANLTWKFEKEKPFYQELTTETKQEMKVMGMDVTQTQKQTFYFKWTPLEQKDKDWVLEQEIVGVKMDIKIGGNSITYDSTNPGQANNPLADFFKALLNSKFKLTLGPDMKVKSVEGRDEFLKKLVSANQQMKPLLEAILSEDALKQMADPTFAAFPGTEKKKDETWKYNSVLKLGPIGSYDTTYEYKYLGKDEKEKDLDKIGVTATLKYEKPSDTAAGGLPFKIKDAKLDSKNGTGTILYDPKAQRMASSELKLELSGTLDIDIGGMSTKVDLKQNQTTTSKITGEDPIKKKQ